MTANPNSMASAMRHWERFAFHLSIPNKKNAATLMVVR